MQHDDRGNTNEKEEEEYSFLPSYPLSDLLTEYLLDFQNYIKDPIPQHILKLLNTSNTLFDCLTTFRNCLSAIKNQIHEEPKEHPDTVGIISIQFESKLNALDFSKKILAIHLIYDELTQCFKDDSNIQPLEIIKIESGSLFGNFYGHKKIISTLKKLLTISITYLHHRYIEKEQANRLKDKIKITKEIIDLRKMLKSEGLSTDHLKANIEKAEIKISKELNRLLEAEPEVILDGQKYEVTKEVKTKLLEYNQKLLPPMLEVKLDLSKDINLGLPPKSEETPE